MNTAYEYVTDPSESGTREILERAGKILAEGGLVVFPTETVYGLGANATDDTAAARIYAAKGRPSDNPLIVHIAEPQEADAIAITGEAYYRLARHFMPGPLTVILPVRDTIPKPVTAGLDTVAVRCPSHPVARALIDAAGVPIAAPSANLSGSPSPTTGPHVRDDMDGRVDMILDGGPCAFGLESTIVKVEDDGSLLLLRPGAVTKEDIEAATGMNVTVAAAVLDRLGEGEKVLSPGMKYRHYAPKAPLVLLFGTRENRIKFLAEQKGRVAYLAYSEEMEALSPYSITLYDVGSEKDELTQASRLFRILREADKQNFDCIYAPTPSKDGVGMALYNRMIRAAAHRITDLTDTEKGTTEIG